MRTNFDDFLHSDGLDCIFSKQGICWAPLFRGLLPDMGGRHAVPAAFERFSMLGRKRETEDMKSNDGMETLD